MTIYGAPENIDNLKHRKLEATLVRSECRERVQQSPHPLSIPKILPRKNRAPLRLPLLTLRKMPFLSQESQQQQPRTYKQNNRGRRCPSKCRSGSKQCRDKHEGRGEQEKRAEEIDLRKTGNRNLAIEPGAIFFDARGVRATGPCSSPAPKILIREPIRDNEDEEKQNHDSERNARTPSATLHFQKRVTEAHLIKKIHRQAQLAIPPNPPPIIGPNKLPKELTNETMAVYLGYWCWGTIS